MTLVSGSRLGGYEISSALGAGGMGEVYRAVDTRLGRAVAIKILPDAFASDPDRVPRFEREAKMLAALNHPNIAALFGMEQIDQRHLLVMELVEGATLADKLKRGPLPIEEALSIGIQIADALEAAHERGIVHRDLKPANVKITPEGKVKVLDFGLAKAMEAAPADHSVTNSPTLSMMATQGGVVLGTAAYMSPEQAKGTVADQRSDIFSFGVVLFEMLTGRQPFSGDTAPEIMASVLVRDADFSILPRTIPSRLRDLVRRCLEKQPKKRWQAIGDVRAELEVIAAAPLAQSEPEPRIRKWPLAAMLITGVAIGAVGSAAMFRSRQPITSPIVRFSLRLDGIQRFGTPGRNVLSISPDGTRIVFAGATAGSNTHIFVRSIDQMAPTSIESTAPFSTANPVVSPDGRWVVFWAGAEPPGLRKVPIGGGAVQTLCRSGAVYGLSWSGDSIIFAEGDVGIRRVSGNGGEPETLVPIRLPQLAHGPSMLPDGKHLLYTLASVTSSVPSAAQWDQAEIIMQPLDGTPRVMARGADARYLPTGHLVYAVGATLFAVRVDLDRQQLTGEPIPVVEEVSRASGTGLGGAAHFAVSNTGTLAYVPKDPFEGNQVLAIVSADGAARQVAMPAGPYSEPRLSPDGTHVAFVSMLLGEFQIWIEDLQAAGPPRRLTFGGQNMSPVWSPDGRTVAFQSNREGDLAIFQQRIDGTGIAERLTRPAAGVAHFPEDWSRDGTRIVFREVVSTADTLRRGNKLWMLPLSGERTPQPFSTVAPGRSQGAGALSPDGKWMAYGSNESGSTAYYVMVEPVPPTGAKYQVATDIASTPVWARDGRRLFIAVGQRVSVLDVRSTMPLSFSSPAVVQTGTTLPSAQLVRNYDVFPNGRELLVLMAPGATTTIPTAPQINVVLNWFDELKTRVP